MTLPSLKFNKSTKLYMYTNWGKRTFFILQKYVPSLLFLA